MTRLPIRDDLRDEQPYGAPQLPVPVVLNVNENPYPPPESLVADAAAAVADVTRGLNRYPDREATQLRADLARYLEKESGVTVETRQVWAANGSNEIMQQVLQAFGGPGRTVMSFAPTYSMYPEYARNTNTGYVTVQRTEDFAIDRETALDAIRSQRPNVIVVASPNNPTGTAVDLDLISEFHRATDGMVVVDEAYAEFRRAGTPSATTLVPTHPRLVVMRTMSKAFAFAGARVGYAVAQIPVVDALRIVRLPYHLSAVTQVVARVALAHADELQANVATLRTHRDALAEWLLWNGFEAPPSDANFIFFGRFDDRHTVWQGLVDRGVLVREVGPDGWLRVSIGRPEENAAFKSALLEVVDDLGDAQDQVFGPVARRSVGGAQAASSSPAQSSAAAPAPGTEALETDGAGSEGDWSERAGSAEADATRAGTEGPEDPSVEVVGEKLQALRDGDGDATVLDGLDLTTAPPQDDSVAPASALGGRDDGADDAAASQDEDRQAEAREVETSEAVDDETLNERADEHDDEVALAVLRDQAESAADQLAGDAMEPGDVADGKLS